MRVRWALEEVSQPYDARLVSASVVKRPAHLAMNTMEPPIVEREMVALVERDTAWYAARLPLLEDRVRVRLGELSKCLGDAEWLDGDFSAGHLLMVGVLFRLNESSLLDDVPTLSAYVARGQARPAFKRACDAQMAVFTARKH